MRKSITNLYKSKKFLVFETIILYIIPLIILNLYPNLYQFRTIVMILSLPYIMMVILANRISFHDLGLSKKYFLESSKNLILPTILFIFLIMIIFTINPSVFDKTIFSKLRNIIYLRNNYTHVFLTYALLSAPLQELIYRGYMTSRLELVSKNKIFIMIFTILSFLAIHFPFRNIPLYFGVFLLGIIWEKSFLQYRNLSSLSISHAIIGGVFVYSVLKL